MARALIEKRNNIWPNTPLYLVPAEEMTFRENLMNLGKMGPRFKKPDMGGAVMIVGEIAIPLVEGAIAVDPNDLGHFTFVEIVVALADLDEFLLRFNRARHEYGRHFKWVVEAFLLSLSRGFTLSTYSAENMRKPNTGPFNQTSTAASMASIQTMTFGDTNTRENLRLPNGREITLIMPHTFPHCTGDFEWLAERTDTTVLPMVVDNGAFDADILSNTSTIGAGLTYSFSLDARPADLMAQRNFRDRGVPGAFVRPQPDWDAAARVMVDQWVIRRLHSVMGPQAALRTTEENYMLRKSFAKANNDRYEEATRGNSAYTNFKFSVVLYTVGMYEDGTSDGTYYSFFDAARRADEGIVDEFPLGLCGGITFAPGHILADAFASTDYITSGKIGRKYAIIPVGNAFYLDNKAASGPSVQLFVDNTAGQALIKVTDTLPLTFAIDNAVVDAAAAGDGAAAAAGGGEDGPEGEGDGPEGGVYDDGEVGL